MESFDEIGSRVWSLLLEHIRRNEVGSILSRNFVACNIRVVDKLAATVLRGPDFFTVHISEPCPTDYFKWHWGIPEAAMRIYILDTVRWLYIPEVLQKLNMQERLRFVCLTAASGVLANLQVAFEVSGLTPNEAMLEAAAAAGKLESCKWLRARGCPWGKALTAAGLSGHRDVYEYMLLLGCPCDDGALYAPARGGHTDLMDWLGLLRPTPAMGTVKLDKLMAAAAEGCELATFKGLYKEWLGGFMGRLRATQFLGQSTKARILAAAAGSPTPDWRAKVEWLEALGLPKSPKAIAAAVLRTDGLERLLWLRERGYPLEIDQCAFQAAGRDGNIALVRYLLSELALYQFTGIAAEAAARAGHLDFLKAMHQVSPLDGAVVRNVVLQAARSGHFEVVTWAVRCPGQGVCDVRNDMGLLPAAAESGSVELLDWAWERNPIRSGDIAVAAARGGCMAALEWSAQHHLLEIADQTDMYFSAAFNGDLCTLRWLQGHLRGKIPEDIVSHCAQGGCPIASIDWLVDNAGCRIDTWDAVGLSAEQPGVWNVLCRAASVASSGSSTVDSSVMRAQWEHELQILLQELQHLPGELHHSPELEAELQWRLRQLPTQVQQLLRQQLEHLSIAS
ncbi:hypothetical protein Vafri_18823 [Volvox africanus]|uniref:Ankyrin repeat protein n=1 Tax=Volvox africanus TaxID=51714 RepID=A0A8J4FC75_9CHLO|nr:hypothetical protein Vafri_18823 [Volvox africanus]